MPRLLTIRGRTMSLTEWSRVSGVSVATISIRLKRGKDAHTAVFARPQKRAPARPRPREGRHGG